MYDYQAAIPDSIASFFLMERREALLRLLLDLRAKSGDFCGPLVRDTDWVTTLQNNRSSIHPTDNHK